MPGPSASRGNHPEGMVLQRSVFGGIQRILDSIPDRLHEEKEVEYEHINDDPHDGWWLRPEHRDEVLPQLQESTLEPLDLK